MKTFGQIVREKRLAKGFTLTQLADKLHVSFSTISLWENNKRTPNIYYACDLADVLGCSLDELCGRKWSN
jgi:transcriptional regulator with XRE-family HTH domain